MRTERVPHQSGGATVTTTRFVSVERGRALFEAHSWLEPPPVALGDFLRDFAHKVYEEGNGPEDGCVLCGRKQVLLHTVGKAWACSDCYDPE